MQVKEKQISLQGLFSGLVVIVQLQLILQGGKLFITPGSQLI